MAKVYLSPSSQFDNVYSGVTAVEADVCNKIAKVAESALKRCGVDVKRGDSAKTNMEQRVAESNTWGADYHIPIHTNAGGGQGTEVFAYSGFESNKFVKAVYDAVAKVSPGTDRGIKNGNGLYEVYATTAVCAYVECEFHDTYGNWIYNHVDELGEAIAKGVCAGLGLNYVPAGTSTQSPSTSERLYRVQVGAFKDKKNAENLAARLKALGYGSIIK